MKDQRALKAAAPRRGKADRRRSWTDRARACAALAVAALLVFVAAVGGGPGWVVKSRNLKFTEVFGEIWAWVQSSWNDVLPMIVVACVIGGVVQGLRVAHGRHEGHQGGLGRLLVAGVAAIFAVGIIG
jgi:hypothetical protein